MCHYYVSGFEDKLNNKDEPFKYSQLTIYDKFACAKESIDTNHSWIPMFSPATFCAGAAFGGKLQYGVVPGLFGNDSDCLGSVATYPSSFADAL
jgi:hypothetical protein